MCPHIYMYILVDICTHVYMNMPMHAHMQRCLYLSICIAISLYRCVQVCTCVILDIAGLSYDHADVTCL